MHAAAFFRPHRRAASRRARARGSGRCCRRSGAEKPRLARRRRPARRRAAGSRRPQGSPRPSAPATKSHGATELLACAGRPCMEVRDEARVRRARSQWQTRRSPPLADTSVSLVPRPSRSGATRIAFASPVRAERRRPWWSSVIHRPSSALRGAARAATAPNARMPLHCSSERAPTPGPPGGRRCRAGRRSTSSTISRR